MIGLEFISKVFGLEQKDLAYKLGISAPNVSAWFKGNRTIPIKYLPELSKVFKGLSIEYFQKELEYIDELKVKIHHIETLEWEDRVDELRVLDGDNDCKQIYNLDEDKYKDELEFLYLELNKTIKIDSYHARFKELLDLTNSLDNEKKLRIFKNKNPEEFVVGNLNRYLDYSKKVNINGIDGLNAIDSFIYYLDNYHLVEEDLWGSQELFPNERLLSFYKDLKEVLTKHEVL